MSRAVVLCLVNGPWQALSLVASLQELSQLPARGKLVALLVDMEPGSTLELATQKVLRASGIAELHALPKKAPLNELGVLLRTIATRAELDLSSVDTLFTYGFHRPIARYVLHLTRHANVVVYEEGLRAYVPPATSLRERTRMRLASLWGKVDRDFGMGWSLPSMLGRELSYCLLLGRRLPLPASLAAARVHHVPEAQLQSALLALPLPKPRALPSTPSVVIIGQYYARLKQMPWQVELDAYADAAQTIVARGQQPIFRGHIREDDDYFAALKARCPSLINFNALFDEPSLPVELYAGLFAHGCAGVVSFSSSALFYLSYVYGLPAHTLLRDDHIARMNHPHKEACLLAHQHLPQFHQLRPQEPQP